MILAIKNSNYSEICNQNFSVPGNSDFIYK
jgi:hypothetical protein